MTLVYSKLRGHGFLGHSRCNKFNEASPVLGRQFDAVRMPLVKEPHLSRVRPVLATGNPLKVARPVVCMNAVLVVDLPRIVRGSGLSGWRADERLGDKTMDGKALPDRRIAHRKANVGSVSTSCRRRHQRSLPHAPIGAAAVQPSDSSEVRNLVGKETSGNFHPMLIEV